MREVISMPLPQLRNFWEVIAARGEESFSWGHWSLVGFSFSRGWYHTYTLTGSTD